MKEDNVVATPTEGNKPENGHRPFNEFLVMNIKVSDFAQISPYTELLYICNVVVAVYTNIEHLYKLPR